MDQEINCKHIPGIQGPQFFVQILFFIVFSYFITQFTSHPLCAPLQFLCKPGSFVSTQSYWFLLSSIQLCHVCVVNVIVNCGSHMVVLTNFVDTHCLCCVPSSNFVVFSFHMFLKKIFFFHSAIVSYWRQMWDITRFPQQFVLLLYCCGCSLALVMIRTLYGMTK